MVKTVSGGYFIRIQNRNGVGFSSKGHIKLSHMLLIKTTYMLKATNTWKRNFCSLIIYFGPKVNTAAEYFLHFFSHLTTKFENKKP